MRGIVVADKRARTGSTARWRPRIQRGPRTLSSTLCSLARTLINAFTLPLVRAVYITPQVLVATSDVRRFQPTICAVSPSVRITSHWHNGGRRSVHHCLA